MSEPITVTMDELKLLVDVEVIKNRTGILEEAQITHQRKEEEIWKEVFNEIKLIRQTQNEFPLKLERCKDEVETGVKKEYITKAELRTMLRTAMFVGGLAVGIINSLFAYIMMHSMIPKKQEIIEHVHKQNEQQHNEFLLKHLKQQSK